MKFVKILGKISQEVVVNFKKDFSKIITILVEILKILKKFFYKNWKDFV